MGSRGCSVARALPGCRVGRLSLIAGQMLWCVRGRTGLVVADSSHGNLLFHRTPLPRGLLRRYFAEATIATLRVGLVESGANAGRSSGDVGKRYRRTGS